ncbi:MAG: acetyl-CoA carboxylase, carboxyltransferase subunit beta [Rhodospirillales bacterium]
MNWLTNFVRPKIRALAGKTADGADKLWLKCAACGQMMFHRDLEAALFVCTSCGHHLRMGAKRRLAMLFDDAQYQRIELPKTPHDPLKFRDLKRYADRLRAAQAAAGEADAIVVAHGAIGGMASVVAAFEFEFMGGSMGVAVGEALVTAANLARIQAAPLIVIPASGGARMQEGILSLMQMPRTVGAAMQLRDAGLPYIVVLTDPTTGGVTASFAMLADIAIAEPNAVIGFAGARVIEETIRETLPEGFQRAEYLLEHGMVDMVVRRKDLRATLVRLLGLLLRPESGAEVLALQPPHGGEAHPGAALGR